MKGPISTRTQKNSLSVIALNSALKTLKIFAQIRG